MSEPRKGVFYLVIFRKQVSGMNQRAFGSVASVMRFIETEDDNERRGCGSGGYDFYYVDVEALEVAHYDLKPLRALMKPPKERRA